MSASRLLSAAVSVLCLALAGCGGDDEADVARLLDRAFDQPIESADVELDSTLSVRGVPQVDRPIRLRASGPYRSIPGRPPEFDIDLTVGVEGRAASIDTGRVTVGDRAFVKFQDSFYELPGDQVDAANRAFQDGRGRSDRLGGLGIDPRSWIRSAEDEGEEEVVGVRTRHLSGRLDVRRVIGDLNRFVARAGPTLGTGSAAPRPLPRSVLDKAAQVVRDPTFDVYVGVDDDRIRRLSTNVQIEVPEADRRMVRGLEAGSLELTLEFRNVGGDQRIVAPVRSRPLSELTKQLGGAGALGLGALGGAQSRGGQGRLPGAGGEGGTGGGGEGKGAGGAPGSSSDPEAMQRYADCLDKADPRDTAALQRCSRQLRR